MVRYTYTDNSLRVYEIMGWTHTRKDGHKVILERRGTWYSVGASMENGVIFITPRQAVTRLEGRPQYTKVKNLINNLYMEDNL